MDELQRAAPVSARSFSPRSFVHGAMLPVGRWGQWSQAAPQDVGEEFGLDSYFWVGSSLHIKLNVCISTNNGCRFSKEGKKLLLLHVFSTGATLASNKVGKVGVGRRVLFLFTSLGKREETLSAIAWCLLPFIAPFPSTPGSNQS